MVEAVDDTQDDEDQPIQATLSDSTAQTEQAATMPTTMADPQALVENGRAFFCSELVAKCFKLCNIMQPTEQASCNFLPVDFATEANSLGERRVSYVDGVQVQPL